MSEIIVIVGLFVLALTYMYGCGEACCWPDKDPFRRIRYWLNDADYVHSEDVPLEYGMSNIPQLCRRFFAAHRRSV